MHMEVCVCHGLAGEPGYGDDPALIDGSGVRQYGGDGDGGITVRSAGSKICGASFIKLSTSSGERNSKTDFISSSKSMEMSCSKNHQ